MALVDEQDTFFTYALALLLSTWMLSSSLLPSRLSAITRVRSLRICHWIVRFPVFLFSFLSWLLHFQLLRFLCNNCVKVLSMLWNDKCVIHVIPCISYEKPRHTIQNLCFSTINVYQRRFFEDLMMLTGKKLNSSIRRKKQRSKRRFGKFLVIYLSKCSKIK